MRAKPPGKELQGVQGAGQLQVRELPDRTGVDRHMPGRDAAGECHQGQEGWQHQEAGIGAAQETEQGSLPSDGCQAPTAGRCGRGRQRGSGAGKVRLQELAQILRGFGSCRTWLAFIHEKHMSSPSSSSTAAASSAAPAASSASSQSPELEP